jgi:hypothetical protein
MAHSDMGGLSELYHICVTHMINVDTSGCGFVKKHVLL